MTWRVQWVEVDGKLFSVKTDDDDLEIEKKKEMEKKNSEERKNFDGKWVESRRRAGTMNENFFSQQRVTRFKFMNYSSNSIRQRERREARFDQHGSEEGGKRAILMMRKLR